MKDFLINHWDSVFGTVFGASGIFAYINERKKSKIDAFSKMQEAYQKFVDDSNEKIDDLKKLIEEQNKELEILRPLKSKMDTLEKEFVSVKILYETEKRKNALCGKCKTEM